MLEIFPQANSLHFHVNCQFSSFLQIKSGSKKYKKLSPSQNLSYLTNFNDQFSCFSNQKIGKKGICEVIL